MHKSSVCAAADVHLQYIESKIIFTGVYILDMFGYRAAGNNRYIF